MEEEKFKELCLGLRQALEHAHTGSVTLSDEDRDRFLQTLEEDEPNEALQEAIKTHNDLVNGEVD